MGTYFRDLKIGNELRKSQICKEDGEPPIRGKRSFNNLPNSWDDYQRSDYNVKSWKHYRKTQYRSNKNLH